MYLWPPVLARVKTRRLAGISRSTRYVDAVSIMRQAVSQLMLFQYFQRSYLMSHTYYRELPDEYQRPLTREHLPTLYCLGIPFLDEEEIYKCAKSLPWAELDRLRSKKFRPGYLETGPAQGASAINTFFGAALGSEHSFHMYSKYCFVALHGTDGPLKEILVVVYQDTHHVGSLRSAAILRSNVRAVLETYLFPDNLWARRGTFWMLGSEAVFDEDGEPLGKSLTIGWLILTLKIQLFCNRDADALPPSASRIM